MRIRNFYDVRWEILEQQGKIDFQLSDSSMFYESLALDSLDLQDWLQHFKRKKKCYVLAEGYLPDSKNKRVALFTTPGWMHYDGIEGGFEESHYEVHY